MYVRHCKLSSYKQQRLLGHFVAGTPARTAADLVGINKNIASLYFHRLRLLIYQNDENAGLFEGEVEVDESYFGGRRKGKRGRGAAGKAPVFGLLKRNGKVFVVIIPDARSTTLIPIIREKVKPDSIVYSDSLPGYNALDVSEFKHFRIHHSKGFTNDRNHINGIENFWNQAKRHLRRFNGVPKAHFYLYIKECEWRFNNSEITTQLKQLKQWAKQNLN